MFEVPLDVQLERHLGQSSHRLNAILKEVSVTAVIRLAEVLDATLKAGRLWVVS
jgi:hypothetical protein